MTFFLEMVAQLQMIQRRVKCKSSNLLPTQIGRSLRVHDYLFLSSRWECANCWYTFHYRTSTHASVQNSVRQKVAGSKLRQWIRLVETITIIITHYDFSDPASMSNPSSNFVKMCKFLCGLCLRVHASSSITRQNF